MPQTALRSLAPSSLSSEIVGPLLAIITCLILTIGAMAAWSCSGTPLKTAATVVTECATAVSAVELEQATAAAKAALSSARKADGSYDLGPLLDAARSFSIAVGGCALAEVIAHAAAPAAARSLTPPASPTPEERVWLQVKAQQYPGRDFRLASGVVL